jgi:hypothetical protein
MHIHETLLGHVIHQVTRDGVLSREDVETLRQAALLNDGAIDLAEGRELFKLAQQMDAPVACTPMVGETCEDPFIYGEGAREALIPLTHVPLPPQE